MDIITEEMLTEAPPAPADATMNGTGTETPLEGASPAEGQETPKNGKVIITLRSGARIVCDVSDAKASAMAIGQIAKDGGWLLTAPGEDPVLQDESGAVLMHLGAVQLTDAVMVGWTR